MIALTKQNTKTMAFKQAMGLQGTLNNHFLETGQFTYRLGNAKHWAKFSTKDPVGMFHLIGNTFVVTGKNHSVDVLEVTIDGGFKLQKNLKTDGNEVNAACLLNGN